MNYKLSNSTAVASGTCNVGYVKTTYDKLVEKLGEPAIVNSGDKKVNCEWIILFEDGTVATIYDWKQEKTPKDIYCWHVGGKGFNVVEKLNIALNLE